MTNEEVNLAINGWMAKREKLACPMIGKHCSREGCRFWVPQVEAKVIGPNLPPLLSLQWLCIFDTINDMLVAATNPPQARKGPGIIIPPGIPGLDGGKN